ncbi:MAG TPA: YhdP family protein, partial [Pseudomonadales bacterium]|nr:YhdP family protein [Pseudomonadales bacterium]
VIASRFWGNSFDLKQTRAQLYLKLISTDLSQWLHQKEWHGLQLEQLVAGGELWVSWRKGRFGEVISRVAINNVQLRDANNTALPPINELSGELKWQYDAEKSWNLALQNLTLDIAGKRISNARVDGKTSWDSSTDSQVMDVQLSQFDAGVLMPYAAALDMLTETQRNRLVHTAPEVLLKQVQLHWQRKQREDVQWHVSGYFDDFRSVPFEKLPGLTGVSGFFALDKNQGVIDLAGNNVVLDYPSTFRQPISAAASGQLRWHHEADGFHLESGTLRAHNDHAHGAVQLSVYAPFDGDVELALHASLYDGNGEFTPLYLPAVAMKASLVDWLDKAIKAGHLLQGDIVYNGPLKVEPEKIDARTLQLRFQVENAKLEYLPEWPAVEQGVADVMITNRQVDVDILDGSILGARITAPAAVSVPKFGVDAVPHLKVAGLLAGDTQSGLSFLKESPIHKKVGDWINEAQGEGAVKVKLNIDVPLAKSQNETQIGVDVNVEKSTLTLASAGLKIDDVNGVVNFNSNRGLSAKKITGKVFGDNATASISTLKDKSGEMQTKIAVVGQATIYKIAEWNNLSVLKPLQGKTTYNAELSFQRGEEDGVSNNRLRIWSPLKGVQVSLPEPLYKSTDESSDFYCEFSLGGDVRQVNVQYANKLTAAMEFNKSGLTRGQVVYGQGRANYGGSNGLDVFVNVPEFDMAVWKDALSSFSQSKADAAQTAGKDKGSANDAIVNKIHQISLQTALFKGFGQTLKDVHLTAERKDDSWQLDLQSERMDGTAKLPDTLLGAQKLNEVQQPIDIHIYKIKFPAPEKKADQPDEEPEEVVYVPEPPENDPLYRVDPRELPGVNLQIDELWQGDVNQGSWSINAYPTPGGLALSKVDVSIWGMRIVGEGAWKRAENAHGTEFDGTVTSTDVAKVISNLDYAPTLESNDARIKATLNWEGSPAWFSLKRASGNMNVRIKKGRFVKATAGASAARVLGILNFETLGRRLQLDFSDLYKSGVAFDSIGGKFAIKDGLMKTDDLTMRGPSTQFEINGDINARNKRVNLTIAATVPVSRNLVLPAAATGGLPLAATAYLIEKTLGSTLDKITTLHYDVSGHWNNPQVQRRNIILPNAPAPAGK